MHPTDEALARELQEGSEDALAALMLRYEPKLMRYGRRLLVGENDDAVQHAVQDVFISLYQNIEGFDIRLRFSPWIYRIAHNAFMDVLRQRAKQPLYGIDLDTIMPHPLQKDGFAIEKENEEMRVLVEEGLDLLTARQREILVLYYFEELSYKEIADVLRVPIGTVGVRLARARATLTKKLPNPSDLSL